MAIHDNHITKELKLEPSPEVTEKVGLDIMVHIAQRFESTDNAIFQTEVENLHPIPAVASRQIIDRLIAHGLLIVAGENADKLVPGH